MKKRLTAFATTAVLPVLNAQLGAVNLAPESIAKPMKRSKRWGEQGWKSYGSLHAQKTASLREAAAHDLTVILDRQ
jgi:hypothetical protein